MRTKKAETPVKLSIKCLYSSEKPIFQRGVTDKRVRPTIAREGSKLDFVRRGPLYVAYNTTKIVLLFQLLSMSRVSL